MVPYVAIAMRHISNVRREANPRAALPFESPGERSHALLICERASGFNLPPCRTLAGSDEPLDPAIGDMQRLGILRGARHHILTIRIETIFAAGGIEQNRIRKL